MGKTTGEIRQKEGVSKIAILDMEAITQGLNGHASAISWLSWRA